MDYENWGYCTTCGDKRDAKEGFFYFRQQSILKLSHKIPLKACQVHGYWDAEGFKECVKVCANGENPENLEHVDLWWETNDGWISIYDFESADEFIGLVYVSFHLKNPILARYEVFPQIWLHFTEMILGLSFEQS